MEKCDRAMKKREKKSRMDLKVCPRSLKDPLWNSRGLERMGFIILDKYNKYDNHEFWVTKNLLESLNNWHSLEFNP